ncbi:MAG: hypothetical protein KC621_19380 [Myxococcales bacterium]|nr:hypothetical protein [Myxococcales bacterium]
MRASLAEVLRRRGDLAGARECYLAYARWARAHGRRRELVGTLANLVMLSELGRDRARLAGDLEALVAERPPDEPVWGPLVDLVRLRLVFESGDREELTRRWPDLAAAVEADPDFTPIADRLLADVRSRGWDQGPESLR